jgi:hypothetical protein
MRFQSIFAPVSATLALLFLSVAALAQEPSSDPLAPAADPQAQPAGQSQPATTQADPTKAPDRVLGVLPNNRMTQETDVYTPITVRRKFYIGLKDSTDYPVFVIAGVLAGVGQLTNSHPRYGQGAEGFGRRYGAALADQVTSVLLTESVMPSLFHQDPRYFRLGKQRASGWRRFGYSLTRILVTKNDRGKLFFNFSEVIGNAGSAAIGNLYYPGQRTLGDNAERLGLQLSTDALSNLLREFGPDIIAKIFHKK